MTEEIKIFESLTQEEITANPLLLEILELNGEQLTYYFEENFLDNPFIEFEYPIEHRVSQVPQEKSRVADPEIDIQSPSSPQTLETFLFEQVMLYRQTPIRDAMVQIVPLLDERGYLPYKYQELAHKLQIDPMTALDAITLFQQLEPTGIGAYNLQECLMLQTDQDQHSPSKAYFLLENYFSELLEEDYAEIIDQTGLTLAEIKHIVNYYHTLRTRPATLYERIDRINLIPDVELQFLRDEIQISVNRQYYPRLIFNQDYYAEMQAQNNPDLIAYIRPHKEFFQKMLACIHSRETLLVGVTKIIVKSQLPYLKGESKSPLPLLIKDISQQMRLSESIVSSIITNKNLAYGEKVVPLSDFINVSARVGRSGLSALNIQGFIKDILLKHGQPISDQEIIDLLAEQKIIISQRLVERYRQNIIKNQE
ncbi:RNA polymerase factor sigma-54 [Facklamia miroungae]|uniref:RNA polymerase sigma-54 factor n=1 Tax=Facklamia miroungae TaxID=120956 RepID=A0A1G7SIM1_9LACT|nr:RNA polymerase subunit sigma-54 [Facklamia miroungae]NKZ29637.1 RNA polymerase subunit sigma-54 [Facklamia miroungae]SDG22917.1 RNA polymerase sigma-54 factor [Facklamia miroungae]